MTKRIAAGVRRELAGPWILLKAWALLFTLIGRFFGIVFKERNWTALYLDDLKAADFEGLILKKAYFLKAGRFAAKPSSNLGHSS